MSFSCVLRVGRVRRVVRVFRELRVLPARGIHRILMRVRVELSSIQES